MTAHPMITFYQFPQSHFCAKVRIVLLEKGLEFETPPLPGGSTRSAEFLALNPLGKTPVLVDGDTVLGESEVIVEYLNDRYPTPPLLPGDAAGRARSRLLSRMHDLHLAPALSGLYFGMLDDRMEQAAAHLDTLRAALDMVEGMVAPDPWLLGPAFGLCDAAYPLSFWYAMRLSAAYGRPLPDGAHPKLATWFEAARARPSVALTLSIAESALA